ncbi:MAG: HAMP domain-containing histidine kinase [Oscillospiraceae bacterium]|nr:HAMP domain-containing histidine kinase [Oscillospiraceae bacterium]
MRPLSGLWAKLLISYIALSAVVLGLLNFLPLTVSRDLIFDSKSTSLMNQAYLIGVSVEAVDSLAAGSIATVMSMLDTSDLDGVVVTDSDALLLYDSRKSGAFADRETFSSATDAAFAGHDWFRSSFRGGVFTSAAAVPVMRGSRVAGAVVIYQRDPVQGEVIMGLRSNILRISLVVMLAAAALGVIMASMISGRMKRVLKAIQTVREGEYSYRIDVTGGDELSVLESEFNSLTDRLQKTEEVRRQFVSDASHELKTPLASIRLLADSIVQSDSIDTATMREFAGDIGTEAERLARTTEKLLSLTRFDSAVVRPRERVDVCDTVRRVMQLLRPLAAERHIELRTSFTGDCAVFAADDDIYQIVLNLTENAVKYNVEGGSVLVTAASSGGEVTLRVEDTGIGIPEKDLPHIFERFYRVDKARAREAGGSGLGLSIVRSAVQEHGGEITAERLTGGGMAFTAVFPYCPPTEKYTQER